jgi:malate permease and related proteins
MFILSFQTTFSAMLQIFLLGGCGFLLVKRKILNRQGLEMVSGLVIQVFFPCLIFSTLVRNFDFHTISYWWVFPLLAWSLQLTGLGTSSLLLALTARRGYTLRNEFRALNTFQNGGFIPLLIAAALPQENGGQLLSVYIFLFVVGFDAGMWTVGVKLLSGGLRGKWEILKMINPPIATIVLSLTFIAVSGRNILPEVILKPIGMLAACALPLGMMVVGGNLALTQLKKIPIPDILMLCVLKLVLLPVLAIGALTFWRPDWLIGLLVIIEASMPSAVTLSVISEHYRNRNSDFVNQGIFFTHVLAIATIPIFLMLYARLL